MSDCTTDEASKVKTAQELLQKVRDYGIRQNSCREGKLILSPRISLAYNVPDGMNAEDVQLEVSRAVRGYLKARDIGNITPKLGLRKCVEWDPRPDRARGITIEAASAKCLEGARLLESFFNNIQDTPSIDKPKGVSI